MGSKKLTPRHIIVAGGEIRDYKAAAARIEADDFIICADSGYSHCKALGITPGLLVGDFDSIGELPPDIPLLRLAPDKDYTDTDLAVKKAIADGAKRILMLGMLGGRLDHELANLQTLMHCAAVGVKAELTDGKTHIWPLCGKAPEGACLFLEPRENYYFSLICLSGSCAGVTIRGGMYPLEDYTLRFDEPRAVSNEFTGVPVKITLLEGSLLVVCTPK